MIEDSNFNLTASPLLNNNDKDAHNISHNENEDDNSPTSVTPNT